MTDISSMVIRHLIFPLWTMKNRSTRLRLASELNRSQFWPAARIGEFQLERCRRIVRHAYDSSSFYREKYDAAGVDPDSITSLSELARLPTISKEEIQRNRERMVSSRFSIDRLRKDMTGGSTGSPLVFHYDDSRHDSREAASIRHDKWAGWNIGERKAVLWGAPQDTAVSTSLGSRLRERLIERRIILDAANLNEESLAGFAARLLEYNPVVIQAYSSTLALFARFLSGKHDHGIHPRGIITSAEVLTAEDRRLIEETFRCPVFNRYGCREFGVIASECEFHEGMHVNAENLLVEVEPSPGESFGEMIVTDLQNYAMPMIRYRIRDVGMMIPGTCKCGRGLPRIELIGGRVSDFLLGTNGKKVSGIVVATYVITNIPGIRQVQFRQDEPGSLLARIVQSEAWAPASERMLFERLRLYLGQDMNIRTQFVADIPREKSGKFRFSISNL